MSDIAKEFLQAREDSIKYEEEQYEKFKKFIGRCEENIKLKIKFKRDNNEKIFFYNLPSEDYLLESAKNFCKRFNNENLVEYKIKKFPLGKIAIDIRSKLEREKKQEGCLIL